MTKRSEHVAVRILRPADVVYDYVADPRHLPDWAEGLGSSIEEVDGRWVSQSPMGEVSVAFAPPNAYGVLDHDVTLPDGQVVTNPLRVLADGDACDVVFTVRQADDVDDEAFDRDRGAVARDLEALKALLE